MAGESQKVPESGPDPTVITTQIIDKEIRHLRELMEERLHRLEEMFAERDRRYGERFDAQQTAVDAAFAASEKAVEAAFVASEKAVDAAFKSSQEAVTKAEVSIEKRADSTYVTLNDLQRQLTNLMPRSEAEQRISATAEAIHRIEQIGTSVVSREEYSARHAALQDALAALASRMDKQEGYSGGAQVDRSLQAIRAQVESNTQALTGGRGERVGSDQQRTTMFAFAGFIATLLAIAAVVAAVWPNTPG